MEMDKATSETNLKRLGQIKNNILEATNSILGYILQKYAHRDL